MPQVYVGIGSNIERASNVRLGVAALRERFGDIQLSSVFESEAVGFDGEAFYNLVAGFQTDLGVEQVAAILREIEGQHGRVRGGERYSARTLDIDLLIYGELVACTDEYRVPRDEIARCAFVLQPLAEIAPDLCHPEAGESFASMWAKFDKSSQRLHAVDFSW